MKLRALLLACGALAVAATWAASDDAARKPGAIAGDQACAACHEDIVKQVARTVHGAARPSGWKADVPWGCEGCHGPGQEHVDAGGDASKIVRLGQLTPEKRSEACLGCHGGQEERINFRRSEHQANEASCDACHAPHGGAQHDRLLRQEPNALCFSCHADVRNAFSLPFHHKVPEGAMKCVDCHNQHGGFARQQRQFGTDASCLKCHSDKQGPFTFEHLALRLEGCTGCHLPHGSNNPRLLTRHEQQALCIECHSRIVSPAEPFAVGTPSFHNLTTARIQSCTTCHVMIHGSNISHVFFE
jgi:DmsE family decaheme c-type cytochrome